MFASSYKYQSRRHLGSVEGPPRRGRPLPCRLGRAPSRPQWHSRKTGWGRPSPAQGTALRLLQEGETHWKRRRTSAAVGVERAIRERTRVRVDRGTEEEQPEARRPGPPEEPRVVCARATDIASGGCGCRSSSPRAATPTLPCGA